MKYLREKPWLLALILIAIIAIPGFLRVEYVNNKTDNVVECVREWADQIVNRDKIIREAANKRTEAIDQVFRAASSQDRNLLIDRINNYVFVSDEFKLIQKSNPIPDSPKISC